ncbi:MAG: ABC transporter permease, partial [Blastocatellia bacterium]
MRIWREFRFILKRLNRQRSDKQLDAEMRSHLEMEAQRNVERGMSPVDARNAAARSFGSVVLAKEDSTAIWGFVAIERLIQDVRYSVRLLVKNPTFSLVAIATLGLGIGANTAIFSVINGVLFNSLPYPNPDRLVTLASQQSVPDLDDLKSQSHSFEALGGVVMQGLDYTGDSEPLQVQAALCNADLFRALGMKPVLGRGLSTEEDRYGGEPVVVLSNAFWQERFAADPTILGRKIPLSGTSYTVIGVMPARFAMPGEKPHLWVSVRVANPVAAQFRG